MKSIFLTNWTNPDMRDIRTYVTSYAVRVDDKVLFTIDLNKQLGFFQICEFVSTNGRDHFIIEQTNRVGVPKIAAFDKATGTLLGTFKGNQLVDIDENLIFTVERLANVKNVSNASDDFIAIGSDQKRVLALFCRLPRKPKRFYLFTRLKIFLLNLATSVPKEVFEVVVKDEPCCDQRMLAAIAVIIHNRGAIK